MKIAPLVAGLALLSAPLLSSCTSTDPKQDVPAGPPSVEEMMAMWAEMAATTEHHRHLDPMVGTFRAETTFWMEPGGEPMQSGGTMVNEWIHGGRFLQSRYAGDMMGQPFEGLSLMGYDKMKQRYVATWCDSMSTFFAPFAEGTCSAGGSVITMERDIPNPMTGEMEHERDVITLHDRDHHTFEMFMTAPGRPECKSMVIEYTRTW